MLDDGRVAVVLDVDGLQGARARGAEVAAEEGRASVVVAEDSPVTRGVLVELLEQAGYRVRAAEDGEAAWGLVEREVPALVLTDWEMPELDGLGLTRRLREGGETARVPVVVLTTHGSEADVRACLAAGADAFLSKRDFEEGELLRLIRRLIG